MKLICTPPKDLRTIHQVVLKAIKKDQLEKLELGLVEMQKAILQTPVYTGRTLANFRWTVGSPSEDRRAAVAKPLLPGRTSDTAIGLEPRRAANAGLVSKEFRAVMSTLKVDGPFQRIYLTNNMPNFTDVEYGTYASGARTPPGGMTRRGEKILRVVIKGVRKS